MFIKKRIFSWIIAGLPYRYLKIKIFYHFIVKKKKKKKCTAQIRTQALYTTQTYHPPPGAFNHCANASRLARGFIWHIYCRIVEK